MERTAQGEQAGNESRKAAQARDFDTTVTSFFTSHFTRHSSSQYSTCATAQASSEVGLALTRVAGRSFLFHPGTFLSVPARRRISVPGRAGRDQRGASGGPRQLTDSLTVTGASEDLPCRGVCLCMCACIERAGLNVDTLLSARPLLFIAVNFYCLIFPSSKLARRLSSAVCPRSSVSSANTLGSVYCPIK